MEAKRRKLSSPPRAAAAQTPWRHCSIVQPATRQESNGPSAQSRTEGEVNSSKVPPPTRNVALVDVAPTSVAAAVPTTTAAAGGPLPRRPPSCARTRPVLRHHHPAASPRHFPFCRAQRVAAATFRMHPRLLPFTPLRSCRFPVIVAFRPSLCTRSQVVHLLSWLSPPHRGRHPPCVFFAPAPNSIAGSGEPDRLSGLILVPAS